MGDAINTAAYGGLSDTQKHYREAQRASQEAARKYREQQEEEIRRNKEKRAQYVRTPNGQGGTAATAAAQVYSALTDKFKNVGAIKGPIKTIAGGWGFIFFLILLAGSFISHEFIFGIIVFLVFGGLTGLLFASGLRDVRLLTKARSINRILGEREYCSVDELASSTASDRKTLLRDLKAILNKGFFKEGFLDKEGTTFMNSRKVYDEYLKTSKYHKAHPEAGATAAAAKKETQVEQQLNNPSGVKLNPEQQAELRVMMTDGQNAIKRLHELNDEIPGEAITAKLNTTEGLLNDIFNRVKEHPDQMKKCHKLMDYHLPMMLKLVEAYAEYDKVTVPGPEIIKAKDEIEKTMDVINEAFIELLNRMFQDSVWDVTADAQVLKSMLTQEGLARDIVVENREE